jgi:hypothetical protein
VKIGVETDATAFAAIYEFFRVHGPSEPYGHYGWNALCRTLRPLSYGRNRIARLNVSLPFSKVHHASVLSHLHCAILHFLV